MFLQILEAITSPPPQMSMPMADGPSPHDIYYDALPQDSVIRAIDSPAVEKVIINPFEEGKSLFNFYLHVG